MTPTRRTVLLRVPLLIVLLLTLLPISALAQPAKPAATPVAIPAESGTARDAEAGAAAGWGTVPGPAPAGLPRVRWVVPARVATAMGRGGSRVRPVIASGLVWHQTDRLRAYDLVSGALRFDLASESAFPGWLAVAGGLVLARVPDTTPVTDATIEAGTGSTVPGGGRLAGIDAATGAVRWVRAVPATLNRPAVLGDTVWLTGDVGALLALDGPTGRALWARYVPTVSGSLTAPAVVGDTVYVSSTGGMVGAYDAATGAERWTGSVGGVPALRPSGASPAEDASAPLVIDGRVIVARVGADEPLAPMVHALDAATGAPRWSVPTRTAVGGPIGGGLTAMAGQILVPWETGVAALDPETGAPRWVNLASPGFVAFEPSTVVGDTVLFGQFYGSVNAIDRDGAWRWHGQTQDVGPGSPYVAGGVAALTDIAGRLTVFDGGGAATERLPVDQPTADGGPLPVVDLSGLPPCDIAVPETPPPARTVAPDGSFTSDTPRPVLPANPGERAFVDAPNARLRDLPAGEPVDAATVADLRETADRMAGCARTYPLLASPMTGPLFRTPDQYAAAFTARFVRTPWYANVLLRLRGDPALTPTFTPPPVVGDDVRRLADGRVLIVAPADTAQPLRFVWVLAEIDGLWLVDEVATVNRFG